MEPSDKITKGFNAGYLLQKHDPELAKTLLPSLEGVELPYFQGVMAGSKQFVLEQELEKEDLYPGMDDDFDIDISDKDLDQNLDKDDFDIDI